MAIVNTYKVRIGNTIPIVSTGEGSSTGNIIFTFGTETQEVISCSSDSEVVGSSDMCLLGGEYFSANYRALPAKVNGDLVFVSNLTKAPVFSEDYRSVNCGSISSSLSGDF